jgi:hypothetical protein
VAKLYITEFSGLLPSGIPASQALAEQQIVIGSAANQSLAFGVSTRVVRLQSDVVCSYSTTGAAASATCARLAGNAPAEYVTVVPGGYMSAITNT